MTNNSAQSYLPTLKCHELSATSYHFSNARFQSEIFLQVGNNTQNLKQQ
ncbi:hypothetical protein SAMN04515668_2317 [Hymenobacter arizonensis]|uniref:Uncharacterized protein n=1 Tax=Hymenobacter arizonensis TaxID=1227077 RepID=A0A1I5Y9Z0_HYMAR|nr:hypothetical protein SAMN04515668_2317 [Hymenobacter arizonensis]